MKRFLPLFLWVLTFPLYSHGTEYSILSDRVIKVEARFDTGEAFADSEVLVFPPDRTEAAYTLKTDSTGIFYFEPDRTGTWILQVRGSGGHGLRINLPVDESGLAGEARSSGLSLLQKLMMVLCVTWGAAGTALYFKGRKN